MDPTPLLFLYCGLILVASFIGGYIPLVVRLTHNRMELAVSFVAGLMLGVGVLHLLPHAIAELGTGRLDYLMWSLLGGFLAMFFIERFFCYHHHDAPTDDEPGDAHAHEHTHDHGDSCHHGAKEGGHRMTWTGAAIGMTLHSLLDGVALAASVAAETAPGHAAKFAGLGTFLVVFCHKPFDSLTLGTLLSRGGRPAAWKHVVNVLFSLAVAAGVLLFHAGLLGVGETRDAFLPCALAFAAGTFLCIAMSDLLPELQFHHHDRAKLSFALLAGLAIAWAVGFFETTGHEIKDRSTTNSGP